MTNRSQSEETIFSAALLKSPHEREAYLDHACGSNTAFRKTIADLIQAHEAAGTFLHDLPGPKPNPVSNQAQRETVRAPAPDDECPGSEIGRYKLLEKIGEGGFGEVFVAEQREPIRRRVALKIIKLGMDTRQVVARFEVERQALAIMDHPNIAKVLDAGATSAGRPYFVMELVRGVPITQYCDQNELSTNDRLKLFASVCQAIQHAHQKGIIHRDIKPSNILVTLHDGVPVPKVIDFGIAKATQGELTDKTIYTQFQQFIGTPAYISPEQAEMSGLDIDTRADIYSLGVLLYELLVGKTPFDGRELLLSGLDAMRRTIREQEPLRPSTRLNTLSGDERTTAALRRASDPLKLSAILRGDVDWIVMKCLEKDRTRRYETANALALDIHQYLRSETVSARPPSASYQFQKFVRRHRLVLSSASILFLALAVAGAVIIRQHFRAAKAEQAHHMARLSEAAEQKRAALLSLQADESKILTRVIAGLPLREGEEQLAREKVAALTARVVKGLGDDADHDLLARFLARNVRFTARPIQKLTNSEVLMGFSTSATYPANGVGLLVTPTLTAERQPVTMFFSPIYLAGGDFESSLGSGLGCPLDLKMTVATPGRWEFAGILDVQLAHRASDDGMIRMEVDPASLKFIGKVIRIVLHPRTLTFLNQMPADYPVEARDDAAARKMADEMIVSPMRVETLPDGRRSGLFRISVPGSPKKLPFALRVDLLKLGNHSVMGHVANIVVDTELSVGDGSLEKLNSTSWATPKVARFDLQFVLPESPEALKQPPPEIFEIGLRSAREAAQQAQSMEFFLFVPPFTKTGTVLPPGSP